MTKNNLEKHLQELCNNSPEYTALLSTWNLNKKTCIDALKTVIASYPHFSMHDVSHAEAVVTKIEMLLGDRIHTLSPTDTWLILHAAYAHDLGMILKWEDIEKFWKNKNFTRFLESSMESIDSELNDAANTINSIVNPSDGNNIKVDPLKLSKHVTVINAAYFRKYHSEISRKYINLWEDGLGIDLGHSGLIQPRLIKLLGRICELHTVDSDKVLELDYQTDGIGSDYAHPRFVAMMLRLGDLLDADNGRFNPVATMTIGALPDSSVSHQAKHEATTHLLVTPTDIEFRSDCPDQKAYLETRNFITWLESEIDFLKKNWDLIVPKNLGGYVPRFDKKEILIEGVPDIEGVANLKFQISQEKAFQIVEGSNLYNDRFICFREIIQNAMDATKIQLWKDLVAGNYVAWMKDVKITKDIQPFDIEEAIYRNYTIQINLRTLDDGRTQVEIVDRGTGISVDNFKRMCNVGTSTSIGSENEEFISTMPGWLRPTAGFGIGLQSIFLLTDNFEIITSTGIEAFNAKIHSNRSGGYLQLKKETTIPPRGTKVIVEFKKPASYSYSMFGETMAYLCKDYDYFQNKDYIGEMRTLESIRSNCTDTLFPIKVSSSVDQYKNVELLDKFIARDVKNWKEENDRYCYEIKEDCSTMTVWDKLKHTYGIVTLIKAPYSTEEMCFKGVKVSK